MLTSIFLSIYTKTCNERKFLLIKLCLWIFLYTYIVLIIMFIIGVTLEYLNLYIWPSSFQYFPALRYPSVFHIPFKILVNTNVAIICIFFNKNVIITHSLTVVNIIYIIYLPRYMVHTTSIIFLLLIWREYEWYLYNIPIHNLIVW